MNIQKRKWLFLPLFCLLVFVLISCSSQDERDIKKMVENEFEQLEKNNLSKISKTEPEMNEVFTAFFKDFSFRIKKISIKSNTAKVDVTTKNIDTYALAKDYSAATLSKRIEEDANPDQVNFSLKDSYLLLGALLKDNDYKVKKESYTIRLKKVDKKWEFVSRDELDEAATGNFLGYMSDADLFTPEEIVKIHFDTLKSFDSEQLSRYLSLENFLVTDNSYNDHIGHVMAEQIHKNFDYEILSSKSDGHKATVKVKITSCDFKNIVTTYETELNAYLKTSKSLADGEEGRREKERQLLLDSIANNDAASTTEVTIQMINDGTSWKMQMTQEIAQAVLGGIDSALADISEDVE